MPHSSVILDGAIALIMAVFLLMGIKKGFFRTLADLVLVFIAVFAANLTAKALADTVAELLRPALEKAVMLRLEETVGDLAGLTAGILSSATAELLHTISFGILFLVTFLVLVIAMKIVVGATDLVLHLPVLRQFNEFGGAVLGLVIGCLLAWVAVQTALAFGWWVTPEMAEGSYLLSVLEKLPLVMEKLPVALEGL